LDCRDENHAGGILTVAETVGEYTHAVNRDLIALGYRTDDALISLGDFVSIVLASPSGSALRYAAEQGWSQTDLLLAQHNEQRFGLQYDRPGVEAQEAPSPIGPNGSARFTPQPMDEFTERMERLRARARAAEQAEQSITEGVRNVG
jgi:hypothetical protein